VYYTRVHTSDANGAKMKCVYAPPGDKCKVDGVDRQARGVIGTIGNGRVIMEFHKINGIAATPTWADKSAVGAINRPLRVIRLFVESHKSSFPS